MAHELDFSKGTAAIAYLAGGELPWHGYGRTLAEGATIEEWTVAAGLNYVLTEHPLFTDRRVAFDSTARHYDGLPSHDVVVGYKSVARTDTGKVLSVVSSRYNIVQPGEVLGFFSNLVDEAGYKLETAGALKGGRRYWALATTGDVAKILGQDEVRRYLLLSTSCDGSLATTAQYTSIRVVCNNTLSYAVVAGETGGEESGRRISVKHNTIFNPADVQGKLAASQESWDAFVSRSTVMAKTGISVDQAVRYFATLIGAGDVIAKAEQRTIDRLLNEWSVGVGAEMDTARGTLWGLLNAVTHDVDHARREREAGNRMDSAWFGAGASMKAKAETLAIELLGEVTA